MVIFANLMLILDFICSALILLSIAIGGILLISWSIFIIGLVWREDLRIRLQILDETEKIRIAMIKDLANYS